jgi:hypothetical protein
LQFEARPGQIVPETLSGKKTHDKKRAGQVAQVVEQVPSNCEALSPNPTKKRKVIINLKRNS